MSNKSNYIAIQVCVNGKYYAYGLKVPQCYNLLSVLDIKGIVSANICSTKKECSAIVEDWNEGHKANGRGMFDTPQF